MNTTIMTLCDCVRLDTDASFVHKQDVLISFLLYATGLNKTDNFGKEHQNPYLQNRFMECSRRIFAYLEPSNVFKLFIIVMGKRVSFSNDIPFPRAFANVPSNKKIAALVFLLYGSHSIETCSHIVTEESGYLSKRGISDVIKWAHVVLENAKVRQTYADNINMA